MSKIVIHRLLRLCLFLAAISVSALSLANPIIPIPTQPQPLIFTASAPNLNATAYILIDATSGKILAEKNADVHIPPASLTKLMSLYVISSAIKSGQIHLDDKVRISEKAWKTEGSRMFVKVGDQVPVRDLLQGIIVASGNDATVALAEYIAGSEESFVSLMNQQAKLLGMTNSHFVDCDGLPNNDHYSTAHDLALLTQAYIKNFPEDYSYYGEKWFEYQGIRQPNRNRLLWRYQYADGLKTGHTEEAGYCLVGSAKKDGMRLVSVVLGEPNDEGRTEDSIRLLTYGFRFFETHQIYNAADIVTKARIWGGTNGEVAMGTGQDFYVTIPTGQFKRLITNIVLNSPLKAPIAKGQSYGNVQIVLDNNIVASQPLIALDNSEPGGLWRRATDTIRFNIGKYFSKTDEKMNTG